jgi:hypothetical protein
MNDSLDILAQEIRVDIARREQGSQEWTVGTINLCLHLAAAREQFPDNAGFGKWCDSNQLKLSPQDRAAAILIGRDASRCREVLAATKRRSLRLIHTHDYRLTSAGKTKPNAARARAFAAYDRRKAAGEELTHEAVAEEAGTSGTPVRAVFTTREAEAALEAKATERARLLEAIRPLEEETLVYIRHMPQADKKRRKKEIEEFHYWIRQQAADMYDAWIKKWKADTGADFYEARLDKMEKLFASWPHSVMRRSEYNTIMRYLHPDTAASRSDEQRADAFRLFTQYRPKMVSDHFEDVAKKELTGTLPRTLEEMLARRRAKA